MAKIHLTERERYILEHLKYIFSYVFQALLFLFLLTLLVREFYPELINSKININWFMIIVIVFGALSILFPVNQQVPEKKQTTWKEHLLVIILGIAGAFIIFLKLKALGWLSYVISILGGMIIILLSWLLLNEEEENS